MRTPSVRYTEWRDWKTCEVTARELYDHRTETVEMKNSADDPVLSTKRAEAEVLLRKQFPKQAQ